MYVLGKVVPQLYQKIGMTKHTWESATFFLLHSCDIFLTHCILQIRVQQNLPKTLAFLETSSSTTKKWTVDLMGFWLL